VRQSIWAVALALGAQLLGGCSSPPNAEDQSFQNQLARASASNKAPAKKNMMKKLGAEALKAPPKPKAPPPGAS